MPPYDAIYLSPHLDDAVFSCGAQIHQRAARGERVLVATPFAGSVPDEQPLSPLARRLHELWDLAGDVVAQRREEDRRAVRVLGADALHGPLLEALYRSGEAGPLYLGLEALRGPLHPADKVAEPLELWLRELPEAAEWLAPAGIGRHVDHRLLRQASSTRRATLYEDLPYAGSRVARWRDRPRGGWRQAAIDAAEQDLEAKAAAIACYASQLRVAAAGALAGSLIRQTRRRGERLWVSASAG